MHMDDLILKFQGFHPSDFTRSYLHDKMNSLQDEAPYGSYLQATFSRRDHLFKGIVMIHSSAGKFSAVASGTKLKEVTHRLTEQIRRQLDRWKSQRFTHESIRDFSLSGDSQQDTKHDKNSVA